MIKSTLYTYVRRQGGRCVDNIPSRLKFLRNEIRVHSINMRWERNPDSGPKLVTPLWTQNSSRRYLY